MKDWLEAVKEKLQEANSPLPDGELEILKGIIRRRKTKRILSLASALSAVAVLALVIVLTIGGEENTQKYLAQDACKSPNEVETITSLPHPASFIHPRKPQGVTPNLSKELVVIAAIMVSQLVFQLEVMRRPRIILTVLLIQVRSCPPRAKNQCFTNLKSSH